MPLPNCVPDRATVFYARASEALFPPNTKKSKWILDEIERKKKIWAAREAGIAAKLQAVKKRKQASEEAKRMILARVERERAIRAARGDTSPTWISCPDVPEMERLAA
jgi:hypothetical protein